MKTRKLVLLIADAVLLLALILQLALKAGDKVHSYELKSEPDEITIANTSETYTLVKENGEWFVGDKKYPVNETYVQTVIKALESIKVLDKVATANNEVTMNRYDLVEGKNIQVVAKKDGKVVRSLNIGKKSTADSQSYITVDDGKDIYLAGGGLSGIFDKTVSYFRTRGVYSLDKNAISTVTVIPENGNSWAITRSGAGENMVWSINVPDVLVDSKKASDWFNSLGVLVTPTWHDDADLKGNKLVTVEIAADKKVIVDLYEIPAETEEDKVVYYGFCSETPYQFELAAYAAQKLLKNVEDVIQ